jgi:hypothetical protein
VDLHTNPTTPAQTARLAEAADTSSWIDTFASAPPHVAAELGLRCAQARDLVMTRSVIPFSHFNMVLTLGCPATVDDQAWAMIDEFYGGQQHWIVVNDHSRPADLAASLTDRGYTPADRWDRVILRGPRHDLWQAYATDAELVTTANARQWSEFVCRTYGMPPIISDWLDAEVDRPGWCHAIHRDHTAPDNPIVMARSACIDGGWAWLGIDAPIPGVMAPCYANDATVAAALLIEAAARGAHSFVTDIEAVSANRQGPGYDSWHALGFETTYRRTTYHHE